MNTLEILKAARQLITPPEAWTQNFFARDRFNEETIRYEDAVCYCSLGAIEAVSGKSFLETGAKEALHKAMTVKQVGFRTIADFNDSTNHAEVLAMFDKAIEITEKEEA